MDLLNETYKLVAASKLSHDQVSQGSGVGGRWYRYFIARKYPSPGVVSVQKVYDFLSSQSANTDAANDANESIDEEAA